MPLDPKTIQDVTNYYKRDINYKDCLEKFKIINEESLKNRLAQEYYIARYASKLQESLNFSKESYELLGHQKLQIIQFAGIYEAVISHILKQRLPNRSQVRDLGESVIYKPVNNALSSKTSIIYEDNDGNPQNLFLCRKKSESIPWKYINFKDKVDVAAELGILTDKTAKSMIEIYDIRNSVHIEKVVEEEIKFSIEMCKNAYYTFNDMIEEVRDFLLTKMYA